MAFVLVRVATPLFCVSRIFRDGLRGGYPVAADLPSSELAAIRKEPQMARTESTQGRRFLERDESLFVQRPLASFGVSTL